MKLLYAVVILCFATANAFVAESPEVLVNDLFDGMSGVVTGITDELKAYLEEQIIMNELEPLNNRSKSQCIKDAANDSIDLVDDVLEAVEQLALGGRDITKSLKKCNRKKVKEERRKCFADLGEDLVDYVDKATKSIGAIVKGVDDVQKIYKNTKKCLASA